MNLLKRMIYGLRRQWIVINSVAAYDRNRQAAGSSLGAWENLIGPAQMMAFLY
jgi:capsular polysaccharide transport system permease protein